MQTGTQSAAPKPMNSLASSSKSQIYQKQPGTQPIAKARTTAIYQSLRPNILGLVFCQPDQPSDKWARLLREMIIPDKFNDISHYKTTLEQSVLENMNLELADLRANFDRVRQKNEQEMRSQYISFYENVSLKTASSNPYSHSTMSDRPTLHLSVQNKVQRT
jgi:hypothetical protein